MLLMTCTNLSKVQFLGEWTCNERKKGACVESSWQVQKDSTLQNPWTSWSVDLFVRSADLLIRWSAGLAGQLWWMTHTHGHLHTLGDKHTFIEWNLKVTLPTSSDNMDRWSSRVREEKEWEERRSKKRKEEKNQRRERVSREKKQGAPKR